MGRPSSYCEEIHNAICASLANGAPREAAAKAAGISHDTMHRWMRRGESGETPYASFRDDVIKAEGEAVLKFVKVIHDSAPKNWQAAAWWLERRRPRDFSAERLKLRELEKKLLEMERLLNANQPTFEKG